jgi:hypothetical protein
MHPEVRDIDAGYDADECSSRRLGGIHIFVSQQHASE